MSEFEEKATVEETPAEEDTSLANSDVTTKYQEAAKIANATMLEVMAMVSRAGFNRPVTCYAELTFFT